jgi:hypothetical protein
LLKTVSSLFYPLFQYTTDFVREDFKLRTYLLIGLLLAISVAINYTYNFETTYVAHVVGSKRVLAYIAFFGFSYFAAVIILRVSAKDWGYLKKPAFWILSIIGITLVATNGSLRGFYDLTRDFFPRQSYIFMGRLLVEFKYVGTLFFPLLVVWLFIRKPEDSFFGLTLKQVYLRPYAILLLLMVPVIWVAAQDASFLAAYPKFNSYGTEKYWDVSIGWLVLAFEFLYASAFISVELIFRGFLVIGLARIIGKDAILPMVCMYTFLHFEKPMGEAISSIFGGYLLGIFAYYSKNIWGGICIHMGVALLMEAISFLVKM